MSAKLAAYVNKHVLFQHSSWWSGIQGVLAQNLQGMQWVSQGCSPPMELEIHVQVHSCDGGFNFSPPGTPTELRKQDDFAYTNCHKGKRSPKTETAVFYTKYWKQHTITSANCYWSHSQPSTVWQGTAQRCDNKDEKSLGVVLEVGYQRITAIIHLGELSPTCPSGPDKMCRESRKVWRYKFYSNLRL